MNPECSSPVPIAFEVNDLMNVMKKCSFESVGAEKRRRSGGSETEQATPLNRPRWDDIPDDQRRIMFPGQSSQYDELVELYTFFKETYLDERVLIFASILENRVFIEQLFKDAYPQAEYDNLKYRKQSS